MPAFTNTQIIKVPLSNTVFSNLLIDAADWEKVKQYRWRRGGTGYAVACVNKKDKYLEQVLELGKVDHIDLNKLNYSRSNLRRCTQSQNCANQAKRSVNTSGFKGVYFCKNTNHWRARIKVNFKSHCLGRFSTKEEAALAYNFAATKYFGEFARLNEVTA